MTNASWVFDNRVIIIRANILRRTTPSLSVVIVSVNILGVILARRGYVAQWLLADRAREILALAHLAAINSLAGSA